MADNVTIPASGTGSVTPVVATDDVGGVHYQRVKLDVGGDGVSTPVTAAAPLPVVQTGTPGLPTGAATETTQSAGNTLTGAVTEAAPASDTASSGLNGRLQRIAQRLTSLIAVFTIGAGTEAAAVRVTLPTDGTGKVSAAQSGTWNVTNVSGTVSLPTGASTETTLAAQSAKLPATLGQKAMAASMAVVLASDQSGVPTTAVGNATPTLTNVAGSVSSVTLLASNANRRGASLWNDSTSVCYVKFGSTASATSATVKLVADAYYEVPFSYTGIITGIWVAATGSVRATEVTA